MTHHRRAGNRDTWLPPTARRDAAGSRGRPRADLVSNSPAARIQRMLVLAERFRSLALLRSDPGRLVDVLRNIISLAHQTFDMGASSGRTTPPVVRMAPDQVYCLRELERLLQGLAHGSPVASRNLGHAMDGLLIQCMLLDSTGSQATELANP